MVASDPWLQSLVSFPKFSSWRGERMNKVLIWLQSQTVILGTGWRVSGLRSPWSGFPVNNSLCKHTHTHTRLRLASPAELPTASKVNCPFSLLPWGRARGGAQWLVQHCPLLPIRLHYSQDGGLDFPRGTSRISFRESISRFSISIGPLSSNWFVWERAWVHNNPCLTGKHTPHSLQILLSCHCTKCRNLQVQVPKLEASFNNSIQLPLIIN